MRRVLTILGLLAAAACSSTGVVALGRTDSGPSSAAGAADGGMSGGPSSGTAVDGGMDGGPTCVPRNGQYTCLGGTWPACPSTVLPDESCDDTIPPCMGCSQGVGFTCSCADAGALPHQDGSVWDCVATENTCE